MMISGYLKQRLDPAPFSAGPNPVGGTAGAGEQSNGANHDRFSGPGFAGKHHQAAAAFKAQMQRFDQRQVFNPKFAQHGTNPSHFQVHPP